MDLLTTLPNLSIGVVAILTLGYISREFISHLKVIHSEHKKEMSELHREHLVELKEREVAMRDVEREVRSNITDQLSRNTHALERAMHLLDKKND